MSFENECVISGISGRFPESDNIEELWSSLVTGEPLFTRNQTRWPYGLYGLPPITARVRNLESVDADFFELGDEYNFIDPAVRIDFEVIYEAIWDAGVNPDSLRGRRVSILLGELNDDTHTAFARSKTEGIPRRAVDTTAAAFGFLGPSFDIDTACASSLSALNEGMILMKYNLCDALVIVGNAAHLCPAQSFTFTIMKMNAQDGKSKCLDASADGYCRAEAIGALFIQKRKDAKRIYASILCCTTNTDGYKEEGVTYPKSSAQETLITEAINKANVNPETIKYIESHVTGTAAGDPVECRSILAALRGNNQEPLLIGCLKSNIGHTEGAAGLCAIVKVALIFQSGLIPPNINFENANPNIEGLLNGRLVPVLQPTKFDGDIIPVNSFGFGGSNVCCVLKSNEKRMNKRSLKIAKEYPRLINICGRTEEQIIHTMNWIEKNLEKVNSEFLSLLNDVSKIPFESKLNYRGFLIIEENYNLIRKLSSKKLEKQQLWFVFSGIGIYRPEIVEKLMNFEPFLASVRESDKILKPSGINLCDLLLTKKEQCWTENIIATITIQLALYDTLAFLGLTPEQIVGISLGEFVCAVVDKCITRKDMLLSVTKICRLIEKKELICQGLMAAVEGDYQDIILHCPQNVYPSSEGQFDGIHLFAGILSAIKNFEARIRANNHIYIFESTPSNLIFPCQQRALNASNEVIDDDFMDFKVIFQRSKCWHSFTIHEQNTCFDKEFIKKVLFAKCRLQSLIKCIPENAVVVDISCEPFITKLMKISKNYKRECISLIQPMGTNNTQTLLYSIGEIYNCGHNPQIEKLYPKVEYPVSRETASLSQLFKWDHSRDFLVAKYPYQFNTTDYNIEKFDLRSDEFKFITDHTLGQRILFPAMGFLYFVWRRFSLMHGSHELLPCIEFCDMKIIRAIIAEKNDVISLRAIINRSDGNFLVTFKNEVHCVGRIRFGKPVKQDISIADHKLDTALTLDHNSVYKELRVRGYDYGPNFQGITQLSFDGRLAKVKCGGHLISTLDNIIQMMIFNQKTRSLYFPTEFRTFTINLPIILSAIENQKVIDVIYEKETETVFCDGLLIRNCECALAPRLNDVNLRIRSYGFSPLNNHYCISEEVKDKIVIHDELCLSLIRSMKYRNEKVNQTSNVLDETLFPLLKGLRKSLEEKQTLKEFIKGLKNSELESFPLTARRNELIAEPIQICLQENASNEITVVEVNNSEHSSEKIVREMCRLYGCRLNFKAIKFGTNIGSGDKVGDVIVYRDSTTNTVFNEEIITEIETLKKFVENACNLLMNGGFLLLYFRQKLTNFENEAIGLGAAKMNDFVKGVNELVSKSSFTRVSTKTDDLWFTSILLRKNQINENVRVVETSNQNFEWLNVIKNELKDENKQIWLKAKTKEITGISGFTKCLIEEYGPKRIHCVVDDSDEINDEIRTKDLSLVVVKNNTVGTMTMNTFEKTMVPSKHAFIDIVTKGDFTSLQWFEASHKIRDEVNVTERKYKPLINIYYSALNITDIDIATNRIQASQFPIVDIKPGMEFSGIDENGRRLFGCCLQKAIATTLVLENNHFLFDVPDTWTLEQASTISVAYATVYYSLVMRAKLLKHETVLIHFSTGGVGEAAIRLCLSIGCKIFISVKSSDKNQELMKLFPQLNETNFIDSENVCFEETIMKATNGRGVDVVLNLISDEKLQSSIDCVAERGRFIQDGKYDKTVENTFVFQRKSITFEAFSLVNLLYEAFENKTSAAITVINRLRDLLRDGIKTGVIQPLNTHTFDKEHVETAFRFMLSGNDLGKVVIKIRDENEENNEMKVLANPKVYFFPFKVYIIVGGLGGMGLQLAFWLSERGAKKLVLTSRFGVTDIYQKYTIQMIEKNGTEVFVVVNSLNDDMSTLQLFKDCALIGPVGAIFNLALVLKDMSFNELTPESMADVCAPKITTTDLLDKHSRNLSPKVDYFVCFSSITASMGNAGQCNYGFANSAMEMICKRRKRAGLHALAIQWGLVGDVGAVIENQKSNEILIRGMKPQRIFSCFKTLEMFLAAEHTVCISAVQTELSQNVAEVGDFIEKILHIVGVNDTTRITEKTTIADLGVDSLMIVEIRQMLQKNFNVELNSKQIRSFSFEAIRKHIAKQKRSK